MGQNESHNGVWIFGFGSNMNLNALKFKGIVPSDSVGGKLLGYKLFFDKENGMANILKTNNNDDVVFGVLHLITKVSQSIALKITILNIVSEEREACAR